MAQNPHIGTKYTKKLKIREYCLWRYCTLDKSQVNILLNVHFRYSHSLKRRVIAIGW